jgi:hypothetical protein
MVIGAHREAKKWPKGKKLRLGALTMARFLDALQLS